MHDFQYINGQLFCEDVPVAAVARRVGTPAYLYSHATLMRHFSAFQKAFRAVPHLVAFALKANTSPAILQLFARQGGGADIVSGGELYLARRAGIPPSKIVFAGVGKTEEEIEDALRAGILMFNVESSQELQTIHAVARRLRRRAPLALRVNPGIDPGTHPHIATGLTTHKFGLSVDRAIEEYRLARTLPAVEIVGIHTHIGSQVTTLAPFVEALRRILTMVTRLRREGITIRYLDLGGGLGITYQDERPPTPEDLARVVVPLIKQSGCTLVLEPGRALAGNAGILLTRVLYNKDAEKRFVIVDAGMNDLIRPALYGAYHEILPVVRGQGRRRLLVDVVGPVCESADVLAKDRRLPACSPGDLLAVMSAGAYGFSMASTYNSRPRPPEVLVQGRQMRVTRRRETYRDLLRGTRLLGRRP